MARTDAEKLGKIVELDPTIEPDDFIDAANELVTELLADAGHSASRLEKIERRLAAHFYACERDMRASSESIGGALSTSFQSKIDKGLELTHYGQMAMTLDTTGILAAHNARTTKPVGDGVVPVIGGVHCGNEAESVIYPYPN